ncbi:MAG: caspase family protein [Pseudonocardiaceae bacterium]|nr:caspase family protein [Pseudonocardiaceae bacterium]
MAPLPNPRLSRAILIGVSDFQASDQLPSLPAVGNNLTDLRASLTNPRHGILADENCTTVDNPVLPHDFMAKLQEVVRLTDDFLLVYYAGHGVRHATRDVLYLTVCQTDTEALNGTAVPYEWVKEEIEQSPARTRLLVLDCCYSGLAVGTMSTAIDQRELEVRGSAVIASSPRNARSHSPVGRRHTAFTGQVVALLNDGSPIADEQLTVTSLYRRVSAAMAKDGFPKPMIAVTGTTGDLLLRQLAAEQPATVSEKEQGVRPDPPPPLMPSTPRRPRTPPPVATSATPGRNAARQWTRLILLRFLSVCFALTMAMFVSSLFGVLVGDPADERAYAGDTSTLGAGLGLSVCFGVLLLVLSLRWRLPKRPLTFARSFAGRVLLALGVAFCVGLGVSALSSDTYAESTSGSVAAGRAATVLVAAQGATACGYFLVRGRRARS